VNGTVDEFGRALVTLTIRANQDAEPTLIQAWIDTAFNGELVMPRRIIEAAQLEQTAGIEARLADGNAVTLAFVRVSFKLVRRRPRHRGDRERRRVSTARHRIAGRSPIGC